MLREITIRPALNGWIVGVGCQSLVYTSGSKLVADLTAYLEDPDATEKRLKEEECFNFKRMHTFSDCCEDTADAPQLIHPTGGHVQ